MDNTWVMPVESTLYPAADERVGYAAVSFWYYANPSGQAGGGVRR
jgi:hypothetical protein